MEKRPYKRRKYFIKAGLQLRYMSVIILCMLVASFAVGYLLYLGIWGAVIPEFSEAKLAEKLEVASRLRDYEQVRRGLQEDKMLSIFREAKLLSAYEQAAVANVLKSANLKLIPKLIVIILAMAFAGIFISHKIAGPIYRFEKHAMAIGKGDLTLKFKLRKGDELKDLGLAFEKMVGSLRNKIADALTSAEELSDGIDKLAQRVGEGTEEKRIISDLKANLVQLKKELSSFKIDV